MSKAWHPHDARNIVDILVSTEGADDGFRGAMRPNTKLVFIETPSNPLTEVFDIAALAQVAHGGGALLVVDNCFCTPALQRPLQMGADLVIHSATKYLDGQGRVLGGAVCGGKALMEEVFKFLRTAGPTLSPFNAFGYWSEAGADIRHGRHDEALAAARMGTEIASRTSIGHWWEALAGLAALRGGHVSAAIAHYEAAYYRAPNFRAAMRHLVYLYLEAGAAEKAARVLKALLRAEPDFSAAAVLREDYPAITLRRSGLAERHEAALAALAKAVAAD